MGRGRSGQDRFDDFEPGFGRGGLGLHHFSRHGSRFNRPSTRDRIEYLEEVQRDLEEMTADVASHLEWLRQRESEQAAT